MRRAGLPAGFWIGLAAVGFTASPAYAGHHQRDELALAERGSLVHTRPGLPAGFWTAVPEELARLVHVVAEGEPRIARNGRCETRTWHGVYHANEEHADTSRDRLARAAVLCDGVLVLYAQGYRFDAWMWDRGSDWAVGLDVPAHGAVEHWSGTFGCTVTRLTAFPDRRVEHSHRDTKWRIDSLRGGQVCRPGQ